MYEYPLAIEAKVDLTVPQTNNLEIRAWELKIVKGALGNADSGEYETYPVPAGLGAGYAGLVWEGNVRLGFREETGEQTSIMGGLNVFFFDKVAEIGLGMHETPARIAVIGVVAAGTEPDLQLPPRGKCNIDPLPMPALPDGSPKLTMVLRQLQFSEQRGEPGIQSLEKWPRPGYFLTTIDGPQAGPQCLNGEAEDDVDELDFIALDPNEEIAYGKGDPGFPLAFIVDFYAPGDPVQSREGPGGGPTPGCQIRCWGP